MASPAPAPPPEAGEPSPSSPAEPSLLALLRVGLPITVVMAVTIAVLIFTQTRRDAPPVLLTLPPFDLVDQAGKPFTQTSVKGRPWIADFIFTRCGSQCPAMTARLARLRREAPPGTRLVSFTVDPTNDTPAVLAAYAKNVSAGPEWTFATGSRDALYGLATDGFKLAVMAVPDPGPQQDPFLHSTKFVLVDGEGNVRGFYDSTDEKDMEQLVADLGALS